MNEALIGFAGIFIGSTISLIVSWFDRQNSFRMAALEKRLSINQEAFYMWSILNREMYEPVRRQAACNAINKWWSQNCLYLSPNTRKKMNDLLASVPTFQPDYDKQTEDDKKIIKGVRDLLNEIEKDVQLPPIANLGEGKNNNGALMGSFKTHDMLKKYNEIYDHDGEPLKKDE